MILSKYEKINYSKLPAKAKEAFNFQKASAVLADYGFVTNLLKYDWLGADFLAQHIDGDWLKIQLKSRLTTSPDYQGKNIYIMFEDKDESQWYLFPHDKLTGYCEKNYPNAVFTREGFKNGSPQKWVMEWLKPYKINPRVDDYVYQSKSDHPQIIQLVNKAYQFATDVTGLVNKDGGVSFSAQRYFRDFVEKIRSEVENSRFSRE